MRCLPLPLALLFVLPLAAETPPSQVKPGVRSIITFSGSIPQNSNEQYKMRLTTPDDPAPYDLSRESFEILVPKNYKDSDPHGLFIWVSPGNQPNLNAEWEKVLADEKLIFIGAINSGNNRETPDRIRLAVDANHHLRQLYKVHPDRVYISGHSGGARVASMIGVAYADMFTGAACFMGVNYFRPTQGKDGMAYDRRYFPHPEMAQIAQQYNRFALITGDQDFNLDNTLSIYEQGFQGDGFKGVKLFQIPNQGHNAPDAKWLEKVIEFLDTGK
ncbi:esterase/PHB depolymerase [Prosthecobacter fusiformis]|uniref:Esterase/PHB depolymerase n=1 Tax=Prosthecobacter fusiformis TaxID=48464 RepID=A0A4R7SR82_9BACT|nr:PHB depolymerase family esterase [Prosthecobacter fusiformis]TDU81760.1 esterase/PHB depolymerase [Prosthecobacter fusiformis]